VPSYRGAAFVLRRWEIGESDLLVSFLDRERGKQRGIAKGAKRSKKRFGGLLAPFFLIQMECFERPGNPLLRIEGCTLGRYHVALHGDLEKLLVGCTLLELMERALPEGPEACPFFPLLEETLAVLDRSESAGPLLWVFLVKSLVLLGMAPQFGMCIHCRRPLAGAGVFGFSVPQGGAVCGNCVRRGTVTHRVDAKTLILLQHWSEVSVAGTMQSRPPARLLAEAGAVLEAFLCYHVVRELRSFRVLKVIEKREGQRETCRDHPGIDLRA